MSELDTKYGDLSSAADQQGDVCHRQITAIVNKRKSQIEERKTKHRQILQKQADDISHKMNEINQAILEIKNCLDSNDISLASTYKSRNEEFNQLPPIIRVTPPSLSLPEINTEKLSEMFGSVSELSVTTVTPMLVDPRLTAAINTGYKYLHSVSCVSEDQVWTYGGFTDNTMKLLNLRGDLLTSIQTKSGGRPWDIAVTRDGDLVYTDNNSVNLVKKKKHRTLITLQGWESRGVCCTAAGELLVTMRSIDKQQSKVVRYSGSTETQTIEYDDQGRRLYSWPCYISENRNQDVCVSNYRAKSVVVVTASGKLRFRYTGPPSNTGRSFDPEGITTNSRGHILVADYYNDRVHLLDQDGQFLRYILCDLFYPHGLCVDIRDNLWVAEWSTAKVKRIKYL
jgi:DNA-binding beta-propeller fold protein YncE